MKLVECVPNISEGRDPEKIEKIVNQVKKVPGVVLLDVESDPDHNRSVITFVGSPDAVVEAAFRLTAEATRHIDLRTHRGEHPRIGATDVIPFVPVAGVSMEDCVKLAETLGQRIAQELHIPVYLYGEAARIPERKDLANIRRGEFEGLAKAIEEDPSRKPDFGPPRVHPTAGAVAVGARTFLIAYNVNLGTTDLNIAKAIARKVRARGGGLAAVKALGFDLKDRGMVQVSMNLVDFKKSPIYAAFELVRLYARRYGVPVVESEIVGLVPQRALNDVAEFYLQLAGFQPNQTIEARIQEAMPPEMTYLLSVAEGTPTPGGGSVSAFSLAQGYALLAMVTAISRRSPKLAAFHTALDADRSEILEGLAQAHQKVKEDAQAFEALRAAYRSKDTERIRGAALRAMEVPFSVMEEGVKGLEKALEVLPRISPLIITDLGVAGEQFWAAVRGAFLNVRINAPDAGSPGQDVLTRAQSVYEVAQKHYNLLMEEVEKSLSA